ETLQHLTTPKKTRHLIQSLAASPDTQHQPRFVVSFWLITITTLFSLFALLSAGTTPIALMREFTQTTPEAHYHVAGGVAYQMMIPPGISQADPQNILFVLPERGASGDVLYTLFASEIEKRNMILVVAEHQFYPQPYQRSALPAIHAVIKDIQREYTIAEENGLSLIGTGEGGEILSLYAAQHPDNIGILMTFGATFLHPPETAYETAYMYGDNDPLLHNHDDEKPRFAHIEAWDRLHYITIENAGRTPTRTHLPIFIELLENLYRS
ncbi:MAG: hypothetical protein ACPG7F_21980, partial [Aggregatilineales bacterium]